MWIYMLGKFIHDSYAGEWYNGQWEQTPEYIGNKASMLIGMPRLRQLRIQEGKFHYAPPPTGRLNGEGHMSCMKPVNDLHQSQ